MSRKALISSLATAAFAALAMPAASWAASATATGTITGSTLSAATVAAPSFSANLDLGDQTPTYPVALTTQDTRGTGAGWNLTITSTQFTTGGATPHLLAANASSVNSVASTSGSGTNTLPTNSVTPYPVSIGASAVKFFNAAANTGMGLFTVTPTIGVFVPQNTFAGTYTSTLTLAIVTGP